MLKDRVLEFFKSICSKANNSETEKRLYLLGVEDCLEHIESRAWHMITEDSDSYPEYCKEVLVEDADGDKFVAYCVNDCDWCITNGEDELKLIVEVVRWIELD